ncbi:MAG: glycoside hydrolase family 97 catalytic domain-containing protein [Bacteroidota bacterium]
MKQGLIFLFVFLLFSCKTRTNTWIVESPDSSLKATIFLENNLNDSQGDKLFYQVEVKSDDAYKMVVNPSPLGLKTDKEDFANQLEFLQKSDVMRIDEEYEMLSGKQRVCRNFTNETTFTFTNPIGANIILKFRVYNDGIAFRYELPGEGERTIEKEETGFSIPTNAKVWIPTYDIVSPTQPSYETSYTNGIQSGEDAPEKQGWSFPALFESDRTWLLISEAGVYRNYCGSHLEQKVENGIYKIRFPEAGERYGEGEQLPTWDLPWEMPWRFIVVGGDLNTIVQSNMVYHLSEPSKIDDTAWIHPGKASWSWWSSTTMGRKLDTLKQYVDLAEAFKLDYTLVDAFWEDMKGGTVEELIDYSNNKNIGVWLWYNSGGRRETLFKTSLYLMDDAEARKKEMKRIQTLGVKGIKVDFFCSDKQDVMAKYIDILEDAAAYKLLVNFHGCTLPRGWSRTYPNLLSMEAIMGGENYRYNRQFPDIAPWHNTVAFFVRNTVGPMDYTPTMFSHNIYHHKTTFGHELATSVLFESGITHLADRAESYLSQPSGIKDFLSSLPVAWEETELLEGYPGKFAIVARRSADGIWYVAGVNGEGAEKQINLKLDFLEEGTNYTMWISADDTPISFKISSSEVKKDEAVKITMLPFGGFVVRLSADS